MDTKSKKRLTTGLGVTAAAAAALALIAGTLALFNDDESSPGQSISAGTLDLVLGDTAVSNPISATDIAPGYTETKTLTLENTGTVGGTLTLNVVKLTDDENSCTEPELVDEPGCVVSDPGELGGTLLVTITDADNSTQLGSVELDNWSTVTVGTLGANSTRTVTISVELPDGVDNRVQSDSTSFEIQASLDQ